MISASHRSPRLALLFLASVLLSPLRATADAVPPPPSKCPRGKIGITSHRGPECVEPPPKNCPPGWRPEIRGLCRLEMCEKDDECEDGKQCREADLCMFEYLQEWGYGRNDTVPDAGPDARPDAAPRNRPLFAGPPMRFDPPRRVVVAVDVCGNGRSCGESAQCKKSKVCLPKNVSRPGVWTGPKPSR
jgi:hypothetical protein